VIGFQRLQVTDFGVLERADLALGDQGLVLIRAINHDTDAADSNGGGKTTLFTALSWVLFGEVIGAARPAEEVIRVGAKAAQVTLDFTDGDHAYTVTRRRTTTKSKLTLATDGAPTTFRTQKDTEERIREILGLDWDAFRNTVLYGQGDVKRFADPDTTDAERKRVLKRVLRMSRIDDALKRVRDELRKMRGDHADATSNLRTVRAEVATIERELARAVTSRDRWGDERDRRVASLRADFQRLEEATQEDRATAGQVTRLEGLVARLGDALEQRDALYLVVQEKGDLYRAARNDLNAIRAEVKPARRRVQERQADLDVIGEGGVCPTCRTRLEDSTAALEHVAELRQRLEAAEGELNDATTREANAVRKLEAIEAEGHEARAAAQSMDRWVKEDQRVRRLLEDAKAVVARLAVAEARGEELARRAEAIAQETNPHHETAARLHEDATEGQGKVQAAEAALTAVEAREPGLRFWESAYASRLPSYTLDSVVPFITEAANRYLGFLSDGDLSVEIVTETDLKGGGAKDAIDFRLTIEGVEGVRPSGGQAKKLSLAVDLALMDLVATREGAQIDLVLLDEVLDGLDAEGKARVVVLLRHLREYRSSIFVVSHDPQLLDHFEKVVTVVKKDGKATLQTTEGTP
jgi:DNA repair exonuclease SbcCD ATPase subunit